MRVYRFVKRYALIFSRSAVLKLSRISAFDLRSLATEGTQEFGFEKDREFAARTCSLAIEGTQESPPLKKCDVQVLKKGNDIPVGYIFN